MISLGFTGTQTGMTDKQKRDFATYIRRLSCPFEFHHGDCVGADEEAHAIVLEEHPMATIIIHPPTIDKKRAFCERYYRMCEPKPYLERNADIVSSCDILLVAPKEKKEILRSGTWSTYRRAKKSKLRQQIKIFHP